jgi:multidrug transporter EmrE-like cation transporter
MELDIVDRVIRSYSWKYAGFDLLPLAFGFVMSMLDVVMMSTAKLVHSGRLSPSIGLPISILVYALQPYLFYRALDFESMVVVNLIWNLTSDTLVTLIGVFYFHEEIVGARWLAMVASLIAIALFAYTDPTNT